MEKVPVVTELQLSFIKVIWPLIGQTLVDTLNYSAIQRELSNSQKRGSHNSSPKKGKGHTIDEETGAQ